MGRKCIGDQSLLEKASDDLLGDVSVVVVSCHHALLSKLQIGKNKMNVAVRTVLMERARLRMCGIHGSFSEMLPGSKPSAAALCTQATHFSTTRNSLPGETCIWALESVTMISSSCSDWSLCSVRLAYWSEILLSWRPEASLPADAVSLPGARARHDES